MADENLSQGQELQNDPLNENEVPADQKPLSPEAENVAVNHPSSEAVTPPDLNKAAEELNQSLEQAKKAKTAGIEIPKHPKSSGDMNEGHVSVVDKQTLNDKPIKTEDSSSPPAVVVPVKKENSAPPTPPKKIGKEKPKSKSNARFLTVMGLSFVGLFVFFIVLMVLVIAGGGESSPVLASFGIDPSGIKSFLLAVVNLSFGLLAFLFFILGVIGVFRLLFAKKADTEARGKGVRMSLIGVLPLVFVMFVWLFLYNFISGIDISTERIKAEILILKPEVTENLKAPLEVTFSSENVIKLLQNNGFSIKSVRWDLNGDGSFETEASDFAISYRYNLRGNYNVGLSVSIESEEAPRQYFYPLTIDEAVFSAKPATGTAPLEIQFDATNLIPKGAKVQSLDWDFNGDDDYEITGKDNLRPRYTFEQIGTFNIHLLFIDQNNLVENYYREIEIVPGDKPLLAAEIEGSPGFSGTIPFQIRLDGGKSESLKGNIVNYQWDFGDGSQVQVGRSVSHVYNNPGFYTVSLTVREDSGKEASSTVEVEAKGITSAPKAVILTFPSSEKSQLSGETPFTVSFDASGSTDPDDDIVEYEWNFGLEGSSQVGQKVDFTYEKAGQYTVDLLVRDSTGEENHATLSITVEEQGVKALINAEPEEGTAPLTINFDGSSSSTFNGKIVSYEWDFGDGSPKSVTGAGISHKYNDVGTYTVKLKVTTNGNESAIAEKIIYIREIPLRACFEPSRRDGITPLAITFDAKCSTGAVANYAWDFGDGETSDSRKPAHSFENPGTYNVTLEVSDDKNNVDTFSDVIVAEGELK